MSYYKVTCVIKIPTDSVKQLDCSSDLDNWVLQKIGDANLVDYEEIDEKTYNEINVEGI